MSFDEKIKINPEKIVQKAKTKEETVDQSATPSSFSVFTEVPVEKDISGELSSSVFVKIDNGVNVIKTDNIEDSSVFNSKNLLPSSPFPTIPRVKPETPSFENPNYDCFSSVLEDYYQNSNQDAEKTYNYLKSNIQDNKDKPENIKKIVNSLLTMEVSKGDLTCTFGKIADTQAEVLQQFLTQDKVVPKAICTTMHGFVMETLNETNIPAVLDGVVRNNANGTHATLIYQVEKGKYVCNDYGYSFEVQADNIIDASKLAHKQSPYDSSLGNIFLMGRSGQFYQEYEFKDETAFGDNIDKSTCDSKSLFDKPKQESSYGITTESTPSSITNKFNINNFQEASDDENHQRSIEFENKFSGNTYSFDRSKSVGVKLNSFDHYNEFNTEGELILSTVAGESQTIDINVPVKYTSTNIVEEGFGVSYKPEIYKKDDLTVLAGVKAFETANSNLDVSSDCRGTLEAGVQADYKTPKLNLNAKASIGEIADLAILDYRTEDYGLNYGYKTNFGSSLDYKLNNCFDISASADGFYAKTPALEHYGISGKAEITVTPTNNGPKYFAGVSDEYYKKHLNIGLFNENIASSNTLTAYGGISLQQDLDLLGSYSQTTNQQSKDEKVSLTVKYKY